MDELLRDLKVKLVETLNLVGVNPEDIDENAQFVGG